MGWLELLIVCCIPGSIKLNREYGKTNIEVVPVSFMVIEFLTSKVKDLLSSPSRPESESKTAEAKAA